MKTNINRAIARRKTYYLNNHSTVRWLPNQPVTAVCCFVLDSVLFRCTTTTTKRHSNCNGLSQTNFTKPKASIINIQREIKKTRGLTVQFGPDASKAALQQRPTFCAWSLRRWVWTIFLLQVLQLSCSSLICGKSQCLETGNQFGFTEYNCGLLQKAIQQPQFCLFTDLLVLVGYHLIAY